MKKTLCEKCGYEFANRGGCFNKHSKVCDGHYMPPKKLESCKYCGIPFTDKTSSERANHSRWCDKNPLRNKYRKPNTSQLRTPEALKKRAAAIKKAHQDGKYAHLDYSKINIGRPHTEETKELLRQKALASPHRRLKRKMIEYKGIWLDSTWELVLAQRLDELNVSWIRPAPITWVDENRQTHHYFPDFFLPDYNLYLDPKNPQAVKVQKKKLDMLMKQHNNIIILRTLTDCKNFNVN